MNEVQQLQAELQATKARAFDLINQNNRISNYALELEKALREATNSDPETPINDIIKSVRSEAT